MNTEKILSKFGLSENWILDKFQDEMKKAKDDDSSLNIAIYGKDDASKIELANSIFKSEYIDNRISFVSKKEDIPDSTDIIWSLTENPETSIPCYQISDSSQTEIKKLIDWTIENLDDKERKMFVRHQVFDFELKDSYIKKMIIQHCSAAFAVGAIPMEAANAPLLVTNELAIMARIFRFYGIDSTDEILKIMSLDSIIGGILTAVGRFVSGKLISRFIDPAQIISSAIFGGTASAVTLAFAMSISKTIKLTCKAKARQIEDIKIKDNKDLFAAATIGSAINCLEEGKTTEKDYEIFEIQPENIDLNIQKGNAYFQDFLDLNKEMDNKFNIQQIVSDAKTAEMWNAIDLI